MAATGADAQEECAEWAWRLGRGPSCLDQHGSGMRTPALADTTMLSQAEAGLPHPRVQPDIADQLLRAGKAAHIADCCDETGGDAECQSALNVDPGSASNIDPGEGSSMESTGGPRIVE